MIETKERKRKNEMKKKNPKWRDHVRISNRERKGKGRKELWKKVLKTKQKKKSEIKQKIQNNVKVHRLVTEKKQKKC